MQAWVCPECPNVVGPNAYTGPTHQDPVPDMGTEVNGLRNMVRGTEHQNNFWTTPVPEAQARLTEDALRDAQRQVYQDGRRVGRTAEVAEVIRQHYLPAARAAFEQGNFVGNQIRVPVNTGRGEFHELRYNPRDFGVQQERYQDEGVEAAPNPHMDGLNIILDENVPRGTQYAMPAPPVAQEYQDLFQRTEENQAVVAERQEREREAENERTYLAEVRANLQDAGVEDDGTR